MLRPVPGDPSAEEIVDRMSLMSNDWILTMPGEFHSAAAETWRDGGSNFQRVVILEWPGRHNKTDDEVTVRLMLAPEDAVSLAVTLMQTCEWLAALAARKESQ